MSAVHELITTLVAGGMDAAEAAGLLARAAVEMSAPADTRSPAAKRQQNYRDRNKPSRNVTSVTHNETSRNITNHNENVTPLRSEETPISYLPSSSKILAEKKESKKERKPQKRNAPLPDDWHPSLRSLQIAEEHGQNVQLVEQIFRDYLKSSGKLYADHDAAFNNFIRNQQRFNGKPNHGTSQNRSRGSSLIDALDRQIAAAKLAEEPDPALPADSILRIPNRSIC